MARIHQYAVDSGHLGNRKLFSDFRTLLISLAISFLPRGLIILLLYRFKADSLFDKI